LTSPGRLLRALAITLVGAGVLALGSLGLPGDRRWPFLAGMATLALGTACVLGWAAMRRMSRTIERMAEAVEGTAGGQPRLYLPSRVGHEVERLDEGVRRMRLALLGKVAELEVERKLLGSVVAGIHEGLLLVRADGRIRLSNAALREILRLPFDPQGRPLTEVVRHPQVLRDVETALATGEETGETIVRVPELDRAFQLRVAPLAVERPGSADEVLVLFFDVTRLERLEGLRREFVADVSHELRTPLTSIKAFVETLLDGGLEDPSEARRFLEIVSRHADRMGELIADLTDLSLIETGSIRLELEPLDAAAVVREVLDRLAPLAGRRDVRVILDLEGPLRVRADRRRLDQMLANLLDNAIKFSHASGRVWLRAQARPDGVTLSVKDEGLGIAAGSLEKVFHRFYQEDRARSRELGGTGLGLAIVKHLMRLHGGNVRVESELGRGSEFFLEFPPVPPAPAA
jgi:two-component system phosphate regulon sensor histidine kinase PhoR